ncbi:MAG TPA: hypothetical protein VF982_09350, partial [Anaerolineales bacterium]
DTVEVKLFRDGDELLAVAQSSGRQAKANAMRRKRLATLLRTLRTRRRHRFRKVGRSWRLCRSFLFSPGASPAG